MKARSTMPFAALSSQSVDSIMLREADTYGQARGSSAVDGSLLLEAHNMLVRCLVSPEQLLEVNLFEADSAETRRRIEAFVAFGTK